MERRHPSGRPSASTNDTLQQCIPAITTTFYSTHGIPEIPLWLHVDVYGLCMGPNSNTNNNASRFCSVALLWNLGENDSTEKAYRLLGPNSAIPIPSLHDAPGGATAGSKASASWAMHLFEVKLLRSSIDSIAYINRQFSAVIRPMKIN